LLSLFPAAFAASTDAATPPTSGADAHVTAATTPAQGATPLPGTTPTPPGGPSSQVPPGAGSTGLPPALTPAPTPGAGTSVSAPPANAVPPPVPQGTPVAEGSETEKALEKSVVQIFTSFQEPNWSSPWIFDMPRRASGTGFLIDGNRIMTNAHVVAWTTQLVVRKYHDPKPYFAHVEFVGHDVDLAVLKIDNDDSFYDGMQPLEFGPLPKVRSAVVTYGFPAGGEQISYTRGVVSRIEVQGYVHPGNKAFLACQTDAAINPGNSGGPVIQDDKVVGVAFEGYSGASGLNNVGFFIPAPIIHHFLDDIKDGTYDGVPEAGLQLANLQNPAYRKMLKLPEGSKRGVRVDQILDIPDTQALIKPDDVVLQVGDYPVDEDGTITYEGNTVGVSAAVDLAQNGDKVPIKLWRDGKEVDVDLPVHVYKADHAQGNQYDVVPPYYIYGGLVFTPLSLDYLKTFGSDWSNAAGRDLIYELVYRHLEKPKDWREQPVVLASILNAPVNANFTTRGQVMVDKINGMRIEQLSDVPKAFAAAKGPDSIIEFMPDHHFEVIRTDEAEKATPQILQTYSVPAQSRL
ncbi:MAG TPA: trypsin-like peptidase domain-containing protein, partial [Candidatus Methylacidiphilales bacterium]|nr:trypsin-like peptidase domain-containing protein [Candidatus Methylacidiphilales bacterium]